MKVYKNENFDVIENILNSREGTIIGPAVLSEDLRQRTKQELIDNYLKSKPESGIPLADKTIDDQFVKTLPYYKDYIESIKKAKKTGSIKVKHSEYVMSLQHNELSNMMVEYLKKKVIQK